MPLRALGLPESAAEALRGGLDVRQRPPQLRAGPRRSTDPGVGCKVVPFPSETSSDASGVLE